MSDYNKQAVFKDMIGLRNSEFLKYLYSTKADLERMLVFAEGDMEIYRLQGRLIIISTLISEIAGSKETLEKLQREKPNMSKVF